MKRLILLLPLLLLALSLAAHAQQLPVTMYGFANTTNFTTADAAFVDGAIIPAIQSQVDSGVSCSIGPPATCNIPGGYSWTTPNGYVTTWQGQTCAGTLRASADPSCAIGVGVKSIANLSPNSWSSSYVFTQAFANYACDHKPFVSLGTYYLGQCFKASGDYFQVIVAGSTGQCTAGSATPIGGAGSTGTCTINDVTNLAPLQDVAVDNGYGIASLPIWTSGNAYPTGSVIINQAGGNGLVYTAQAPGGTAGATQPTCGNNTTCSDGNITWKATQYAVLNLATAPTVDTLAIIKGLFPVTWETPFSYSQDTYYAAAIANYGSTSGVQFFRGGFGTGEEQSTHALDAMQHALPYGTLTDLQMETLWTGRVATGAKNEANAWLALGSTPSWKLMLLVNCMTGLSSNGGTDCGAANVELRTMLSLLPAFGGWGSNGLETGDLEDIAAANSCTLGLTQCYANTYPNACTNNWCAQIPLSIGQVSIVGKQEFNISNAAFPATCSSGGCPEVICSSTDTATNCGGLATQANPDLELQQILVLSTTHSATQIELSRNEFDVAFGTPPVGSWAASHPSTVTAYATALKKAALGLPAAVSAAGGTGHGGGTGRFQ